MLSTKLVISIDTSVKSPITEAPPTAEPATVKEPGIFTTPALVPVIQVVPPSPDDMDNWSSSVALAASAPPIITLFEPLVMLSPALTPSKMLLVPVPDVPDCCPDR